jgi:hypothetical protein
MMYRFERESLLPEGKSRTLPGPAGELRFGGG